MRRRPCRAARLVLLCAGLAAAAAPWRAAVPDPMFATAGTLRTWCQGRGTVRASCLGYLAGTVDALAGARPPCLPPKLAGEQVRLLFLDHLNRHPDRGDRPATGEVRAALTAAFPCAPGESPPARPGERVSQADRTSLRGGVAADPGRLRTGRVTPTRSPVFLVGRPVPRWGDRVLSRAVQADLLRIRPRS